MFEAKVFTPTTFGFPPHLKLLGVNTTAEARKTQIVNTIHFQKNNHMKVLGNNTLATDKKTESVSTQHLHETFP